MLSAKSLSDYRFLGSRYVINPTPAGAYRETQKGGRETKGEVQILNFLQENVPKDGRGAKGRRNPPFVRLCTPAAIYLSLTYAWLAFMALFMI